MPEDRRRPTLDTLAAEVGVSRATVSNAYNRPDQLSEQLRERILRAAERLGYAGPDPVARSLATQRCGAVAVLTDTNLSTAFSDPALSITLDALSSAMDSEDHALLLLAGSAEGGPSPERVRRAQADVLVAYSLADDTPAMRAVAARGLPVVVIDSPMLAGAAMVGIDDRGGANLAAQHLLDHGHRRFAILADEIQPDQYRGPADAGRLAKIGYRVSAERFHGYRSALDAAGIGEVRTWEAGGIDATLGARGARWLLDQDPPPTALLCMTDHLAVGAAQAAAELGIQVPEELSIVGFDDSWLATQVAPRLTTIRQDLAAKGRTAGELAQRLLAGHQAGPPVQLPTELIIRESSGPAPHAQ
ncbi:DNA-binding LacI/PurR family transcriptional regulator [Tamaricihabitans halophyticus]|uniref:DNA-binding LacI/PurR family transcriptional regulator n=1 Tax=Tamaricihabitans halophyticus TaxID=1262583 RepID=A0A4R2QN89_9PSEU|nr:LacI family DNA-binding transcriptional regulator [Tamaricihabitans halophyticus]TCP48531.1 DNA-binding LacI/PurR family transcriptional regulator [Tamaricihabitans halophyticus]